MLDIVRRRPGRPTRTRRLRCSLGALAALALATGSLAPGAAAAPGAREGSSIAAAARLTAVRCTLGDGSRRSCPIDLTPPRIRTLYLEAPLLPVLVGNRYTIATGEWRAPRGSHLSVEWLDARGRPAARGLRFEVAAGELGGALSARVCANAPGARSCRVVSLSGAVRTVPAYLQATCGSHRPPAPAYDPNFAFFSAPRIEGGWNPCRPIVWALDTYDMPALLAAPGAGWETLASDAVAQLAAATGVTFTRAPNFYSAPGLPNEGTVGPEGVALAIGFAPQGPDIGGTGGLHGVAGQFATKGEVEIDISAAWSERQALLVLLHELGHAMGLAHPVAEPPAADPFNEVMDPVVTSFTSYQPGDLCGLYELTWRAPCAGQSAPTLGQGRPEG